MTAAYIDESCCGVLGGVAVEDNATDVTTAGAHRHLDRVRDEIGAHVVSDRPAHHPA
jgi:hypothetical protein